MWLDNGIRVTACRSSVLADQVDFRAVRRGGMSVLADSGYVDAFYADALADIGGIGTFSSRDLNKKFSHTKIDLSSTFTPYAAMIEGESGIDEIEQLLQLVNLKMQGVRRDPDIFALWLHNLKASFDDRADDPEAAFSDSIRTALYGPAHPYLRRINRADLDTLDYDHALRLYSQQIANPADWQYIVTGNFTPDSIAPLLATYLGSLPTAPTEEKPHRVVPRLARDGKRDIRFRRRMVSPVTKAYIAFEIHRPYTMVDEMAMQALASAPRKSTSNGCVPMPEAHTARLWTTRRANSTISTRSKSDSTPTRRLSTALSTKPWPQSMALHATASTPNCSGRWPTTSSTMNTSRRCSSIIPWRC